MIGSAKAHYEGIKAFSETDQTEDLKSITLPVLVMQEMTTVVPYKNAAILQDKLLPNSQLKIYLASRTGCTPPRRYHQRRSAGVYPRLICPLCRAECR